MGNNRVFALAALLLVLLGCIGGQQSYEDRLKGFSVSYPAGWAVYDDGLRTIFSPPAQGSQIAVLSTYSSENATLRNLSLSMLSRISSPSGDVRVLSQSQAPSVLAGLPALEQRVWLLDERNGTSKRSYAHFAYARNGQRYYIVFLVFEPGYAENSTLLEERENEFASLLASFKLV